jgi:copper resistance protein B
MHNWVISFALFVVVLNLSFARAQNPETPDDPHAGHAPASAPTGHEDHSSSSAPAEAGGAGMDHGSMQGGSPPPDARDPHAYSGGYDLGPLPLRLGDTHNFGSLLVENLERVRTNDNSSTAYDLQAWYGRDYNRAVLKAEGDIDDGKLQDARTELLWGHAVAAYWDAQLGVRHDGGIGTDRGWLAFGVQGLAPYWFEVEAFAYVGEQGRTALRFTVEYELLLTQKLVLQPDIEANFYGKRDVERELGSGVSDLTAGIRLRYAIRREFAPYVGIEWAGKFGETEDFARLAGEDTKETRFVAGLRFWF